MTEPRAMRVLLVEDDRAFRRLLTQLLRPMGARIAFECATQREALGWLATHPDNWDVALVDLFLAQGNGIALLRACAARPPTQRMVLMSNYSREPIAPRAAEAGADAYFDKSTQLEALFAYCSAAVRQFTLARTGSSFSLPTDDENERRDLCRDDKPG